MHTICTVGFFLIHYFGEAAIFCKVFQVSGQLYRVVHLNSAQLGVAALHGLLDWASNIKVVLQTQE